MSQDLTQITEPMSYKHDLSIPCVCSIIHDPDHPVVKYVRGPDKPQLQDNSAQLSIQAFGNI